MQSQTECRAGRVNGAGLACAVAGASLWGLSFIIPLLMPGVSAWDISLGRYLVFGVVGTALVLFRQGSCERLGRKHWATAFVFAATGYYGCYILLVYSIDLAGPALPTLIMGLTPVSVAVVGNWRTREMSFSRLALPVGLLGAGLLVVNLARHGQGLAENDLWKGMAVAIVALGLLTFYLVGNVLFLKRNPRVSSLDWANAIGCTLMVFALFALVVRGFLGHGMPWEGTRTSAMSYLMGSIVLGLGVSWLGGMLWNHANSILPVSVAGQCIVFWPLSGIIYGYLYLGKWPGSWESVGIAMVFAGVLWGIRISRRASGASRNVLET